MEVRALRVCLLRGICFPDWLADVSLPVVSGKPDFFAVARWWGPALAYMSFIFFMSANPAPEALRSTPDYVLHAGAYFVLALLAVRAFAKGLAHEPTNTAVFAALALAILYGLSDEWHQSYVPGRDSSLVDLAADGVGAILAVATLGLFWNLRRVYESE